MAGFWYPYPSAAEAQQRLCKFADRIIGPTAGVCFSDGRNIVVLRRPAGPLSRQVWLNALSQHVAVPAPAPRPKGVLQTVEAWFGDAMSAYGQAQIDQGKAQLAAGRAEAKFVHDKLWQPAHQFLLRHKMVADGVAVAADVVGVVALVGFVLVAPELIAAAAAGSLLAGAALATGAMAGAGSFLLTVIDGAVFVTEVSGHKALSTKIEDNPTVAWIRISATVMLVPDLPVGATRAVLELRAVTSEAEAGVRAADKLQSAAEAQRARASSIRNPARHPAPVQKHLHRANMLAAAAGEKMSEVERLRGKMTMIRAKDLGAVPAATGVSEASLAMLPPKLLMSRKDIEADEEMLARLAAPAHGMPRDARIAFSINANGQVSAL